MYTHCTPGYAYKRMRLWNNGRAYATEPYGRETVCVSINGIAERPWIEMFPLPPTHGRSSIRRVPHCDGVRVCMAAVINADHKSTPPDPRGSVLCRSVSAGVQEFSAGAPRIGRDKRTAPVAPIRRRVAFVYTHNAANRYV